MKKLVSGSLAAVALLAAPVAEAGVLDKLEKSAKKASKALGESTKTASIKPSDVNPALSVIDANAQVNPFLSASATPGGKPMPKVEYVISGKKNYDTFFRDTAVVSGSVVMAKGLIQITRTELVKIASAQGVANASSEKNLTQIVKAVAAKKGSLAPTDIAMIKNLYLATDGLTKTVTEAPTKAQGLVAQGKSLGSSAPKDFASEPTKVPGVVEGLTKSATNLELAVNEAGPVAKELVELGMALKEIGTGGTF